MRLLGPGVQGWGSEQRGWCVLGEAQGVRGKLANYWGRENPKEWVGGAEGRGLHRREF